MGPPQSGLNANMVRKQTQQGNEDTRMANERKGNPAVNEAEPKESRMPAIAGLAIAAVLLVVGIWLARELTAASKMQDCLMSGRTNCNQIQPQ
jgi:hypothetical protein